MFNSNLIHIFHLWRICVNFNSLLPPSPTWFIVHEILCELPQTYFLTVISLSWAYRSSSYCPFLMSYDPEYFVTDYCWSCFIFFHLFMPCIVKYPEFSKTGLGTQEQSYSIPSWKYDKHFSWSLLLYNNYCFHFSCIEVVRHEATGTITLLKHI